MDNNVRARQSDGDAQYYAIYFNDCTELDTLKKRYDDERFVSGVITVDNYDEIMQDVPNPDKPKVSARNRGNAERLCAGRKRNNEKTGEGQISFLLFKMGS